jgi:ribosomal protein S18 acetylase RimI-like enzyme
MATAVLHAAELQYSFNSKLGAKHLASVYRAMNALPDCFIGVALDAGVPVGVVSGALDVKTLKRGVIQSFGWPGKLHMMGRLLLKHAAIFTLLGEIKRRPPIKVGDQEINACLTAIAVAASHRRKGLASQLVTALEDYFRTHGVSRYWLDTILENSGARSFYQRQGFKQIMEVGSMVVFLKSINNPR